MTPRPPPCMELNSQNSSSSRIRNGRKLTRRLTSRLSWVTLVSNVTPVAALGAVPETMREDVVGGAERVGGGDLVAALDGLLQVEVERLFLVVDRRRADVAAANWASAVEVETSW